MSKKILVIDDEKDVAHIMKRKIQAAGYDVRVAYNGEEGLSMTREEHPHLILTDVLMPIMDGFSFFSEVKNRQDIRHIPIIIATAHGTTEDAFRTMGAKDFLIKPFDMTTLLSKVDGFFKKKQAYKVLIATKLFYLMRNIIDETSDLANQVDLYLTNNLETLQADAAILNPDIIMLDVGLLFNLRAGELVRQLRNHPAFKETTILLIRNTLGDHFTWQTNHQPDDIVRECLNAGASHFIGALNRTSFVTVLKDYCHHKDGGNS